MDDETYEVCPTCGQDKIVHAGKTCGELRMEWEREKQERELREWLDRVNRLYYMASTNHIELDPPTLPENFDEQVAAAEERDRTNERSYGPAHPINSFMSHLR